MLIRRRPNNSLFLLMIIFIIIGIIVATISGLRNVISTSGKHISTIKQVVIDPGHGGVDPGAIGINKANEKDINLAICLYLKDILMLNGYDVIMTRETDVSINSEEFKSISKIKTSDLKNRLKIIENYPNAIALSIHQNEFTSQNSTGAQMFYGRKNDQSSIVAQSIQDAFRENLQPNNRRAIKRSTSDVYIVHNAKNPVVLVECGFISNSKEAKLLCDEEYQQKVAFTIYCGIANVKFDK